MVGLTAGKSQASWGYLGYSGYQPWWNLFAKRYKCLTPEEERLQKFWHDYYDAMKHFYLALDHIDWVAYYKNHGYQINGGCGAGGPGCCGRINYAPVFVSPTLAVGGSRWLRANGPPVGPGCGGSARLRPWPRPRSRMPMYGDAHAGGPSMPPMYAGGPNYPMGGGYPGNAYAFGGYPSTGYPGGYMAGAPMSMPSAGMTSAPMTMPSNAPTSTPSPMPTSPVSSPMPGAN